MIGLISKTKGVIYMIRDLVCNMMVDEKYPPARATYKGKEYYFCCEDCKRKFEENPEKYLREQKKEDC